MIFLQHPERVDTILGRAANVYKHPLLVNRNITEVTFIGMEMVVVRLGSQQVMEVVRLLDESRQRVTGQVSAGMSAS